MLRLFIGTWPAGWVVADQAHREALGGALAFEAFLLAVDVRVRVCILRNDASAAVAAFQQSKQWRAVCIHKTRSLKYRARIGHVKGTIVRVKD